MRSPSHRLLDHPADIGVEARGPDLSAAFSEAVAGLARVITGGAPPECADSRPVALEAADVESLLVDLLDECLFLVDARGWLPSGARIEVGPGARAAGTLTGAPLPETEDGMHVKAVTWHRLDVRQDARGVVIRYYLDI